MTWWGKLVHGVYLRVRVILSALAVVPYLIWRLKGLRWAAGVLLVVAAAYAVTRGR